MKNLVHRRHSIRNKPGIHLNQQGINLARKAGDQMGEFHYVVTSYIERTWETAMVMGYAVNEMRPELFVFGDQVDKEIISDGLNVTTFDFIKQKYDERGPTFDFAEFQLAFIIEMLNKIDDGQSLLMVSHGLIIDIPLVAMIPDGDFIEWGNTLSYCEGYQVKYEHGLFSDLFLLRM